MLLSRKRTLCCFKNILKLRWTLFSVTLSVSVFISWSVSISHLCAGAARRLRQSEAWHRHLRFWRSWIRDEGGVSLSVWHQCGLSCGGWRRYTPGQVGIINCTVLSLNEQSLIFFFFAARKARNLIRLLFNCVFIFVNLVGLLCVFYHKVSC